MDKQPQNKNLLMQYFSFAWQLLAGLGIAVYVGILLDGWMKLNTPLLVWILPLLVITTMMVKVIRDTTKK